MTTRLVAEVSGEIAQGGLARLIQHGLSQAHNRDYVRQTQERLLLAPVLARLYSVRLGPAQVDELLRSLLDQLRQRALEAQGYGPANLVALLHLLRGNLRGLDLSHLSLRGVSLQGIELQDTTLAGSLIQEAVFTEAFDAINGLAISSNGECMHTIAGHPGMIYAAVWGMNGERGDMLVSGGSDGTLRWWIVDSGECLWVREAHQGTVQSLRRSPDGAKLASCGDDGAITLWNLHSGEHLRTLRRDRPYERLDISGVKGLTQAQKASLRALGAIEDSAS